MNRFLPVSILLLVLTGTQGADALPRFAARTGARCQSCHVNPSGGGMRQTFGVQYGREELPVPTWSEALGIENFSTKLTETVSIGADVRTIYYALQVPDTGRTPAGSTRNAFWQMQGDLDLSLRLAKKVQVYLSKGLYSGFEIFGMLNVLPENGSIKIGKFVPNFGLKLDDHRSAVRQYTGFSAELGRPELTGGELMITPGPLTLTAGFYNARDGFGAGTGNQKAVLGRLEGMFSPAEDAAVGIGGNIFTAKNPSGDRTTLVGGFGLFSYREITLIGEADLIRTEINDVATDGLVMTLEASYPVTQGVDVKLGYDFYDPDTGLKSGAVSKYNLGFEFFPVSGVEVRPVYSIVREKPEELRNDEFVVLVHFYF